MKGRLAVVMVAAVLAFGAAPHRHIELVNSSPAADTVLTSSPTELVLVFSADLDFVRSAATMRSTSGEPVLLTEVEAANAPRQLTFSIESEMGAGTYTVSWVAAPKEDHTGRGRFSFEVQ